MRSGNVCSTAWRRNNARNRRGIRLYGAPHAPIQAVVSVTANNTGDLAQDPPS